MSTAPEGRKIPAAEREPRVVVVHKALRQAILEQALVPGMKLTEDTISERFAVSRTIVRQALERLAADELVDIQPHRGASVIKPTLEQARDLFEVRIDIEDIVVQRLCGKLTRAQIAELAAAAAAEDEAHRAGGADYIRLSAQFHVLLAEMTGSPLLERYLRSLVWRSAVVLRLYGRPAWDDHAHEHFDLIRLLSETDVPACRAAMREHLESVLTGALKGKKLPDDPSLAHILGRYAPAPR